ncbi:MAG TPA: amino acid permease [Acidobacteriota bacterium]|jgi:APA family basic amino acid/polyamine antiporter|nr:amino acid permease [Acidobacteriota bacterium]
MITVLLKKKDPDQLISDSETPERRMKRSLTAFDLTALGVGATVGAGIFALTGTAAAGKTTGGAPPAFVDTPVLNFILQPFAGGAVELGRLGAGPAITISFLVAALACALAALCYAELAAMIPISGSAYTYAYATLGEMLAWIIGWDLILEYAVGNIAVATSWSGYFVEFIYNMLGLKFPLWLVTDIKSAHAKLAEGGTGLQMFSSIDLPLVLGHHVAFNIPGFLIVALLTALLIYGIKESAAANTVAVVVKVTIVIFFVAFGAFYVSPRNWVPYAPHGFLGVMGGAAIVFFAFIGFDAVSTTAEEARNPQRDMPTGMIASLAITTVLYIAVSLVLTGMLRWSQLDDAAPVAKALREVGGARWAQAFVSAGALAGMTSVLLVFQLGQPRIFMAMARDGLLPQYFARIHSRFRTPHVTTFWTGVFVAVPALFIDIGSAAELTNIGTLFAFILVCAGVIALRKTDPARLRPFKTPMVPLMPVLGILLCVVLMFSLPILTWMRFYGWLRIGLMIYLGFGMTHSAMIQDSAERQRARFVSASTAGALGIVAFCLDVSVAVLVFAYHPEFMGTAEFLAFTLLLVFCNLVHASLALTRSTGHPGRGAWRNKAIGASLGALTCIALVILIVRYLR